MVLARKQSGSRPEPTPEELEKRHRWCREYVASLEHRSVVRAPKDGASYCCPCCGYSTLPARGHYDICPVCFWEDDGQDDQDADAVRGGPNGALSLTQARRNFREFGACDRNHVRSVRKPTAQELRVEGETGASLG